MIQPLEDFDLTTPAEKMTVEDAEQDLLFLGTHSSTGRLLVQFAQDGEAFCLEIQNPVLRTKMVGLLIDAVGGELDKLRQEASQF